VDEPGDLPISSEALQAISELLQAAAQYGMGVAFEPNGEGWRISYVLHDWPAYEDTTSHAARSRMPTTSTLQLPPRSSR
jgi:hypothetical protein